jgi:hypothetical protein
MSVRFARRSRRVVEEGKKQVTYFIFLYMCVCMFRLTFGYKKYSCIHEDKNNTLFFLNPIVSFLKRKHKMMIRSSIYKVGHIYFFFLLNKSVYHLEHECFSMFVHKWKKKRKIV